jgi:hypothetical protein
VTLIAPTDWSGEFLSGHVDLAAVPGTFRANLQNRLVRYVDGETWVATCTDSAFIVQVDYARL